MLPAGINFNDLPLIDSGENLDYMLGYEQKEGFCRIPMQNLGSILCLQTGAATDVATANYNRVQLNRALAKTGRVRSLAVPVDTAVLTPTRGDVILNRTSNNDPFRWDGAAWTAM